MILISKDKIQNIEVRYYKGIDLGEVMKHPVDGSGGFIFCFVDKWSSEVKKHNRGSKIDNILDDKEVNGFDMDKINNPYVCIYQTSGNTDSIYKSIKENIHNRIGRPWIPLKCNEHYNKPEMGKIPHHKFINKNDN